MLHLPSLPDGRMPTVRRRPSHHTRHGAQGDPATSWFMLSETSGSFLIELPWPPSELSPNKRLHWAALSKHKHRYREACCAATPRLPVPDGPLSVSLTFFRPDRRSYDRDNLLARMKSGLDGMCDSLGIDDKRFSVITIRVSDVVVKGGSVYVAVSKDNQKKHEEDLRPVR